MLKNKLFEQRDLKYRDFEASLIPTLDKEKIIGVRMPTLRRIAKALKKEGTDGELLKSLPHTYLEEYMLHSITVSDIRDYDKCVKKIDRLLPFVDNWAVCDSLRPKCFSQNKEKLSCDIERWISSEHIYTARFGIEMLMVHFLDDSFDKCHLERVSLIKSDDYYLDMMIAWYFATALAKQWESTLPYLSENRLSQEIFKKTVMKALESFRLSPHQKEVLREIRAKKL